MIRAALFDVDGTLYHQPALRAAMAAELTIRPLVTRGPRESSRVWRVLRCFRQVREDLRDGAPAGAALEELQYTITADRTGVGIATVRRLVDEWIFTRPLKYLPATRRAGVVPALTALRDAGLRIGVFSDYPASAKLEALGLSTLVPLQICATDASVNAFKPKPHGFLAACEHWGLDPVQVVYVGDRPDVDAHGARAAGMPCLIVGADRVSDRHLFTPLPSFDRLREALTAFEADDIRSSSAHLAREG